VIPATRLVRDLVFIGGGHAHALALRMLAMEPVAGLRITLISPASHTPYSGMLPGLVAGHYRFEETHIDLARLCQWANVRFLETEVTGLDPVGKTLELAGRPPVQYDLLSIDIGSQPELDSVPGARAHAVAVKPVAGLWQRWREIEAHLARSGEHTRHRVAVVGGGAGSVELVLAMAHALVDRDITFELWCGAPEILQGYNRGARAAVMAALAHSGVAVHLGSRVVEVDDAALVLADGSRHVYDDLFWCTGASAAHWVAASGLSCDPQGFLNVRDTLQALDDDDVFAAGDIATQVAHPRPKAGVYAVRQGPVLAYNLRARLLGKQLRLHRPQQRFLSLLSLGGKEATADKSVLHATGKWVWRWKDRIDRSFMQRFTDLPSLAGMSSSETLADAGDATPYCGGCGAKVGARGLAIALEQLAVDFPDHCTAPDNGDDASPIATDDEPVLVQSLDMLRPLVADPWLMGRIAANHALSDLYACGAEPRTALAAVTLPHARGSLLQRDLYQVLAGALTEFAAVDCQLAGGHSMQGVEMAVGFAVTGRPMRNQRGLLRKRGLRVGDVLVLTKPLGTGVIFAAHMQQQADGRHVGAAIASMLQSNAAAARLALEYNVSACTDVTGFGLLGHLREMLLPGQGANLCARAVPALPGAEVYLARGIRSTGHPANAEALLSFMAEPDPLPLLLDPQTSGGLLLGVAADQAEDLCQVLQQSGYTQAVAIGSIESSAPPRILVN
jgi:selenide,water dikinase